MKYRTLHYSQYCDNQHPSSIHNGSECSCDKIQIKTELIRTLNKELRNFKKKYRLDFMNNERKIKSSNSPCNPNYAVKWTEEAAIVAADLLLNRMDNNQFSGKY